MTDYTPSLEEIADSWRRGRVWQLGSAVGVRAEFDRWLSAHDAEVRASVLAEQGEPDDYWVLGADGEFWASSTSLDDARHYLAQEPVGWIEAVYRRRLPVEENTPHTEGNER